MILKLSRTWRHTESRRERDQGSESRDGVTPSSLCMFTVSVGLLLAYAAYVASGPKQMHSGTELAYFDGSPLCRLTYKVVNRLVILGWIFA